jgi:hypothetical protein
MNCSFRSSQQVICVGSCVFQGSPGKPRFGRSLSLPPLTTALCLEQILLVLVVVLVLDLLWRVSRSARVTRAARFGRSLSLPP